MAQVTIFKFNSEEDTARAVIATTGFNRRGLSHNTGRLTMAFEGEDMLASFRSAITRAVGEGNFVEATYE